METYLQHKEFSVLTDHRSLVHLGEQKIHQSMQQKAFIKLLELQYKLVYKKGLDNKAADALSRQSTFADLNAMSASTPRWLEIIVEGYHQDPQTRQLLTKLSITGANDKGFALVDGLIKHKGKIWLGNHLEAHQAVMLVAWGRGAQWYYCNIHKVKSLFSWPNMKQDIQQYISKCQVCCQAKTEHCRLPVLLQPLPVPSQAWHTISLDFIEGLPKSNSWDTILVVIDKFSKYDHFIPLSHPYTTLSVAQVFINNVYKLYGLPSFIISDRGRIFASTLWKELFKLTDTTLNMSSSYHPQTDGQTKRLNQCLETYLRCLVQACPSKWSQWLSLAEYWYNTTQL